MGSHIDIRIREHDHGVFSATLRLHALAVGRAFGIHITGHIGRSYKADPLDYRVFENGIHRLASALHEVQHAFGKVKLLHQSDDLGHR
ncbi:hypothetical protein D3C87_1577930 [compost metagenome]